jgi:quercetin dioxygenase-like cupin family protein
MKDEATKKDWCAAESLFDRPGLHRLKDLKWEKGSGDFEGCSVAKVGECKASGEQALYVKVQSHKENRYHFHTATTHSLIIRGAVSAAGLDGEVITGKAGDYFRCPANWIHLISHVEEQTLIFTVIEQSANPRATYQTIFVDENTVRGMNAALAASSLKGNSLVSETLSKLPGLHRLNELKWVKGAKENEVCDMAVVSENLQEGRTLAYVKLHPHNEERYHMHTGTTHSVVIKGAVSAAGIDGKMITMNEGDYFRCPENWIHKGSHVTDPTLVFTMRVNPPLKQTPADTVFVQL